MYIRKISLLLLVLCFTLIKAAAQQEHFAKWEKDIAAFEAQDKIHPTPKGEVIVFAGSSSIRLWKTLSQDFPGKPVLNRGFGGAQTADVLHFADRLILKHVPKQVVYYGGGNDLAAGKTPEKAAADFISLFQLIRAQNRKTHVVYISLKPSPKRMKIRAQEDKLNALIQAFLKKQKNAAYLDFTSVVLSPAGKPIPSFFAADSQHLSSLGYQLLARKVGPLLK